VAELQVAAAAVWGSMLCFFEKIVSPKKMEKK
jgi:hypothetical protein